MASHFDTEFPIYACEWHVRPGVKEIEVNSFKHSDDDEVVP